MTANQKLNEHGLTDKQERTARMQAKQSPAWSPEFVIKDTAAALCLPAGTVWRWQKDPAYQARVEALGGRVYDKSETLYERMKADDKAKGRPTGKAEAKIMDEIMDGEVAYQIKQIEDSKAEPHT